MFDKQAMSKTQVYEWQGAGQISVEDEPLPRRKRTYTGEQDVSNQFKELVH